MNSLYRLILILGLSHIPGWVGAQCSWHTQLIDSFEYQVPCPDVISGVSYTAIPQDWAVYSGSYALYLNFVNCNGGAGTCAGDTVYMKTFEVCPGRPTRISSWITTTFSGLQCDMKMLVVDFNGTVLSNTTSILAAYQPAWTFYQSSAFLSTSTTVSFIMITNVDGSANGNDLSMDNLLLEDCYSLSLGSDTLLCDNQSLLLDPGPGFSNYLWSDGSTSQTLTVSTPGGSDTLTYFLQVSNASGCILNSDTLTVIFEICDGISDDAGADKTLIQFNYSAQTLTFIEQHNLYRQIELYNSNGICVRKLTFDRTVVSLDIENLSPGIYFYRLIGTKESTGKVAIY